MNRREVLKIVAGATLLGVSALEANQSENGKNRIEMYPRDAKKLEKFEIKHTPNITLSQKEKEYTSVTITVGNADVPHPSTQGHWIDFIELYADGVLVGRSVLSPELSYGMSAFKVKLKNVKLLKAKAGCNLHGIWSSSLKL